MMPQQTGFIGAPLSEHSCISWNKFSNVWSLSTDFGSLGYLGQCMLYLLSDSNLSNCGLVAKGQAIVGIYVSTATRLNLGVLK